jgi:hypothetical protein
MKKMTCLPLIIILLFFMPACSKPEGQEYLAIKNEKEYSIEGVVPLVGVVKGKMVTRTEGRETINGKEYDKTVAAYSGLPGAESSIEYSRNTPEGVFTIDGKHKNSPEYLSYPFPLSVGTTWTKQEPEGPVQCRVESIETAQLFDKKYENCLKVSFKRQGSEPYEGYEYLAKGIGTVKSVIKRRGLTFELVLQSYK